MKQNLKAGMFFLCTSRSTGPPTILEISTSGFTVWAKTRIPCVVFRFVFAGLDQSILKGNLGGYQSLDPQPWVVNIRGPFWYSTHKRHLRQQGAQGSDV